MFSSQLWQQKIAITLIIAALIAIMGVAGPLRADQQPGQLPINIDIKAGSIVDVLRMLGRAADVDIVITQGVEGEIPSMKLQGKTVEQALWLIAQATGYRCYKVDDTTYIISPSALSAPLPGQQMATELTGPLAGQTPAVSARTGAEQEPAVQLPTLAPPPSPSGEMATAPSAAKIITTKLKVKYEDPRVIALAFGGDVVESTRATLRPRTGPYGNLSRGARAGSLPFTGGLSAPGAAGLGGWAQYPGGMGGLGGGGYEGGGLGGGLRGASGYGGQAGGYGGQAGGAGAAGNMLPDGMVPPIALMQQNVLLVRGTQEAIDAFAEILAYLDQPAKQVEISAKFIEVETTHDTAFGIDWFVSNGSLEWFNLGFAPGEGINVGRFKRGRFEAELRTLISEGRAQIINEPRVTTQNNMPAEVQFSTEIPYFYATITYNQFGQREVDYESDTVSVMQALYVTPRICEDDTIVLDLEPEIDDQVGTVVGPTGETLPIVSTQTVYTQVRIPDGDTLVIGGMIRRNETFNTKKTPLLSEIPIIGELFKSKKKSIRNSELLIFVTPRIIRPIPRQ